MPSIRETFEAQVLGSIAAQHPQSGVQHSYHSYLDLGEELRSGDEMPFVDERFTPRLLVWLGYLEADWIYNQGYAGEKQRNRPDFMVRLNGATVFVVEDKNTTHDFGKEDVVQLQRYTAGTQGYALWTNARTILALQFYPGGAYRILTEVTVDTRQLQLEDDDNSLELLQVLFNRSRFDSMPGILDRICIPEKEWEQTVRPLDSEDAQREFIKETGALLNSLTLAARAQIDKAEKDVLAALHPGGPDSPSMSRADVRKSYLPKVTVRLQLPLA